MEKKIRRRGRKRHALRLLETPDEKRARESEYEYELYRTRTCREGAVFDAQIAREFGYRSASWRDFRCICRPERRGFVSCDSQTPEGWRDCPRYREAVAEGKIVEAAYAPKEG